MTQQKENDMEQKLTKHTCPKCGCDFKEQPIEVIYKKSTKVYFKYINKGFEAIDEDIPEEELFSITCPDCNTSLYSYFYDEFI